MKKPINEQVVALQKIAGMQTQQEGYKYDALPMDKGATNGLSQDLERAILRYVTVRLQTRVGMPNVSLDQIKAEISKMVDKAAKRMMRENDGSTLPVGMPKEGEENEINEAVVPENVRKFAERKGVTREVNEIAKWARMLGKRISGGTAIGKNYSTLVLDISYQGGEVHVNTESGDIQVKGYPVSSFKDFKEAIES